MSGKPCQPPICWVIESGSASESRVDDEQGSMTKRKSSRPFKGFDGPGMIDLKSCRTDSRSPVTSMHHPRSSTPPSQTSLAWVSGPRSATPAPGMRGSTDRSIGAVFDGHNRNGDHEWSTQGLVIEADPGRAFAFECSMMEFHYATWGYRFEPTNTGCRVTEWSEDLRPESVLEFSQQISGINDRESRNRQTMSTTLERLAQAFVS